MDSADSPPSVHQCLWRSGIEKVRGCVQCHGLSLRGRRQAVCHDIHLDAYRGFVQDSLLPNMIKRCRRYQGLHRNLLCKQQAPLRHGVLRHFEMRNMAGQIKLKGRIHTIRACGLSGQLIGCVCCSRAWLDHSNGCLLLVLCHVTIPIPDCSFNRTSCKLRATM